MLVLEFRGGNGRRGAPVSVPFIGDSDHDATGSASSGKDWRRDWRAACNCATVTAACLRRSRLAAFVRDDIRTACSYGSRFDLVLVRALFHRVLDYMRCICASRYSSASVAAI